MRFPIRSKVIKICGISSSLLKKMLTPLSITTLTTQKKQLAITANRFFLWFFQPLTTNEKNNVSTVLYWIDNSLLTNKKRKLEHRISLPYTTIKMKSLISLYPQFVQKMNFSVRAATLNPQI